MSMTLEERLELLARIARGEETEEKVDREGGVLTVAPAMKDRLAAIKLISELEGDLTRAKTPPAVEDETAKKSMRQLEMEWEELKAKGAVS